MQFSVIAEEASFTKASTRLRVAQSWLSARMRKLEDQLGFQLLLRNTRHVVLTERGSEFLQAARSVMMAVEAAEAKALQLRRQTDKRLRIGTPPYSNLIHRRRELIDGFSTTYRDIVVELEVGWTQSLLERLRAGDLDVTFATGRLDHSDLEAIPLCTIEIDLLMSKDHPLASMNAVAPANLVGHAIAVFSRAANPSLYDELYAPLIRAGAHLVQVPEIGESVMERLHGPEHLIVVLFHLADQQFADAGVVRRPLDIAPKVPFSLARRHGAATPIGQIFWNFARK